MNKKLFAFLVLFVFQAQAMELFEYNYPVRARGMGGVYTPFPSDTDAIFVNPAYLAHVQQIGWEIVNLGAGINSLSNYEAYSDIANFDSPSDYQALYGKDIYLGLHGHSALIFPYFGLSYYNDFKMYGGLHNPSFPDFTVELYNDYGFMFAFGVPISPLLSVGMGLRKINRIGGVENIGLSTISSGTSTDVTTMFQDAGSAWGVDLATMAKLPGFFSPSLVAMWKDVGSTQFTKTGGNDAPPRIKDNLILGAGLELDLPGFDARTGVEYRHAMDTGVQFGKKLHLGTEFSLPLIDLRIGLNQGYQTYGAGVDLFFFKVDAAYYFVEKGDYPGQTSDTRMEVSLSMQVGVDADFNFRKKDGTRRKLKQRR